MERRCRRSSDFWCRTWVLIVGLFLCSAFAACSGEDKPTSPVSQPKNGTITGRVIASDGSGGVPNATIEVGAVRTVSEADGSYRLSVPAADRTVVRVDADGFAANVRITRVQAEQSTPLTVQLLKDGIAQDVAIALGGTVSINSSAQVVLPPNALIPQSGGSPAANVTVSMTPIDVRTMTSAMPGDFTTIANGSVAQMESFGAMLIEARDANNVRYSLAPGSTASIRIPVSTRSVVSDVPNAPQEIPLFYFDDVTGRWIQEGRATLVVNGAERYYQGTVSRLSYWNADQVMETVIVNGCVRNAAGQPAANALVQSDGINYSGSSQAYTATDGSFQIPIQRNGQAAITALLGTQLTNTKSAGPSLANVALDSCLVITTGTGGFNMKLTWGASPRDLDSHLFTPNEGHVFWNNALGSLTAFPFAKLDVDDQISFGPEVVTISKLMQGTYVYAVKNYTGTFNPGITASPGRVELTRDGNTTVFAPPTGEGSKVWWHVFNIVVDTQCNVSVVPVNAWLDEEPARSAAVTPTFCEVN